MAKRSQAPVPVELRYHATAMRVLEATPVLSPAALRTIERCGARCGARLPASVREWYSLEGAESLLSIPDVGGCLEPLDRLLKRFARLRTDPDGSSPTRTLIYSADSSGFTEELTFDGTDDPPVDDGGTPPRNRGPFSAFVLDMAWGVRTWPERLRAYLPDFGGVLGPPHLDFLIENFDELPRDKWRGRRNPFRPSAEEVDLFGYRFFGRGCRIRVVADGDATHAERAASWSVHAESESELFAALRFLWPCHGRPIVFSPPDEPGEEMARRYAGQVSRIEREQGKKRSHAKPQRRKEGQEKKGKG
jgi:hypothetical protein